MKCFSYLGNFPSRVVDNMLRITSLFFTRFHEQMKTTHPILTYDRNTLEP